MFCIDPIETNESWFDALRASSEKLGPAILQGTPLLKTTGVTEMHACDCFSASVCRDRGSHGAMAHKNIDIIGFGAVSLQRTSTVCL